MLKRATDGASPRSIRLVIADRQPIVLQGLMSVFAAWQDFEIVASCNDWTSFLEAVRNCAPDVALLSASMAPLSVSEILAIAKSESISTRLVFFTEDEDDDVRSAVAAGACSAISKFESPDNLLGSLRMMTRAESPELFQHRSPDEKEFDNAKLEKMLTLLTQRERQIVRLVSNGLSNKEIARQLGVSHGTVKVHLHNIFQKLAINNRTVLATIDLLQRSAGFGASLLAAFAFAILDDAKASSHEDSFGDDKSTPGHTDAIVEHSQLKLEDGIVTHTLDSGEHILAEVSQLASSAANAESFETARQTAVSILGGSRGPVGSGTPQSPSSPLLAINKGQLGDRLAQQQSLAQPSGSNPLKSQVGFGILTMLAGATFYALESSQAAAQSLGSAEGLADTLMAVSNGTAKSAASTVHREFSSRAAPINLEAFGALAFLHITSADQLVPPHTLAWLYKPGSNETIVYVNTTDHSLDIGDPGLLEIHVQGFVSAADLDLMFGTDGTAVAAALKGANSSLIAGVETSLTTDAGYDSTKSGSIESAQGTASFGTAPTDNGERFHLKHARSEVSPDDSVAGKQGADDLTLHAWSRGVAGSKLAGTFEDNFTFKDVAPYDSGWSNGHGKAAAAGPDLSQPATPAAFTGAAEPGTAPGNSAGHANSEHAADPPSQTKAAGAAEPNATHGNSEGKSNLQHASEPFSQTAGTGTGEAGAAHGHGSASSIAVAHSSETSVSHSDDGPDPSQHVAHSAKHASDPVLPVAAASGDRGAHQELVFHFDSQATPSIPAPVVELAATHHGSVLLGPDSGVRPPAEEHPHAYDDHAQHHAPVLPHHDLLI